MKRWFTLAALLIFGSLMSGCINFHVITTVEPDGSGTYEIGFYFDDSQVGEMEEITGMSAEDLGLGSTEDLFEDMPVDIGETLTDEETGISMTGEVREIDDAEWIFMVVSIPDAEAWDEVQAASERIEEAASEEDEESEMAATDDIDLSESTGILPLVSFEDGKVRVSYDISDMETVDPDEMTGGEEMPLPIDFDEMFNFVLEIRLPNEASDHNGTLNDDGHVEWVLDLITMPEETELYAESDLE